MHFIRLGRDQGLKFRADTNDELIFRSIVEFDEYKLPASFEPGDIIIDIGSHIGSFAYAALSRGAGRAYCYEAGKANCVASKANLRVFGKRVSVEQAAVWRSDRPGGYVYFQASPSENQGSGHVLGSSGVRVKTRRLDQIIDEATSSGRHRIRMMKLDCEGAEFPILFTVSRQALRLVDDVRGEMHEYWTQPELTGSVEPELVNRFTMDNLCDLLADEGFTVRWRRHRSSPNLGYFFATRGGETDVTLLDGPCCIYCDTVMPLTT